MTTIKGRGGNDAGGGLLAEAVALHQAGRLGEAESRYRQVLAANPRQPDALHLLGMLAHQTGHSDAALGLLDQALAINRRHPLYHTNRGIVLETLGRADEALSAFEKAAGLDARFPPALSNLGRCLAGRGREEEALRPLRRVLQLRPTGPDAATDGEILARALAGLGRLDEAVGAFKGALALDPARLSAATGLGSALSDLGRFDEAVALYRSLAEALPTHPGVTFNLGLTLRRAGRADEAGPWLERALALAPDDANIAHSLALANMASGDFTRGLDLYERRFAKTPPDSPWREFPQPLWDGGPLDGELLVWAEQGVGDHLLFARLLPLLSGRGIRAVMECDPRLLGLLARSYPDHRFVAQSDPPDRATLAPSIGAQVPMGGLMKRLAPWPQGFAPPARSLVVDPARLATMKAGLAALGPGPHIGVSWRSANRRQGVDKTLALEQWGPILRGRDACFVNLQYGDTDADIARAEKVLGCRIHTLADLDRREDIEGLAALTAALDLVISTSNVTVHIAAATGTPCRLLLQHVPLWYWGLSGPSVLFYPNVEAFRQDLPGHWDEALAALGRCPSPDRR